MKRKTVVFIIGVLSFAIPFATLTDLPLWAYVIAGLWYGLQFIAIWWAAEKK